MRILAVSRGAPGLGRVVPSLGLVQTLRTQQHVDTIFASYAAGVAYLRAIGEYVVDLGRPDGLFIDSVAPQALSVQDLAEDNQPDLILVDGEFFLPVALAHLKAPVVYLANPHDLLGEDNTFRRVNRSLLSYASAVIVSSLSCVKLRRHDGLVPNAPCIEVPPIIKEFTADHDPSSGPPRVLISMGGGSVGADPSFRDASDDALEMVLDVLSGLESRGAVGSTTVVLGADATLRNTVRRAWVTLVEKPVELTALYRDHDLFIARAGRNATAEARYSGIPTVLIPVTSDRHRGGEQLGNAESAISVPHLFPVREWRSPGAIDAAVELALATTMRAERRPGLRGNDEAARFLANLVPAVHDPQAALSL